MNEQERIEEEFRKSSSLQMQNAKKRFLEGEYDLKLSLPENLSDSEFEEQELLNSSGEKFAFASEMALKSTIIYDDFRKNIRFNSPKKTAISIGDKSIIVPSVGSPEWHKALAGDIANFRFIQSPEAILDMLSENNPLDVRVLEIKKAIANKNPFFGLTYNGKQPTGHSLYAYYQLQSPVTKSLINTEFYCYVDGEIKYTIYALLTEDIIQKNSDGKTVLPESFMKNLDKFKESAVDLRYASLSLGNIKREDLSFLREFSSSIVSVGEYKFPLPKKYAQMDFEKFQYEEFFGKGFPWFDELDKMSKYYLQENFTKEEIVTLMQYIDRILVGLKRPQQDIQIFLNTCIYFKNFVKNKLQINLEFTNAQYVRIDNFCDSIKSFQPFSANSKRLRQNRAFASRKDREGYINAIKKSQEEAKLIDTSDQKERTEEVKDLENLKIVDEYGGYSDLESGYYVSIDGTIWASQDDYIKYAIFEESVKDNIELPAKSNVDSIKENERISVKVNTDRIKENGELSDKVITDNMDAGLFGKEEKIVDSPSIEDIDISASIGIIRR